MDIDKVMPSTSAKCISRVVVAKILASVAKVYVYNCEGRQKHLEALIKPGGLISNECYLQSSFNNPLQTFC
jgi:hypothetical protein